MYKGIYLVFIRLLCLFVDILTVCYTFIFFNIKYEYNITLIQTYRAAFNIVTYHIHISSLIYIILSTGHKNSTHPIALTSDFEFRTSLSYTPVLHFLISLHPVTTRTRTDLNDIMPWFVQLQLWRHRVHRIQVMSSLFLSTQNPITNILWYIKTILNSIAFTSQNCSLSFHLSKLQSKLSPLETTV